MSCRNNPHDTPSSFENACEKALIFTLDTFLRRIDVMATSYLTDMTYYVDSAYISFSYARSRSAATDGGVITHRLSRMILMFSINYDSLYHGQGMQVPVKV